MAIFGILLAFLTAVFTSLKDAFTNKAVEDIDEKIVALSLVTVVWPLTLAILLLVGTPDLNQKFLLALLFKGPLMALSVIFIAKAHKNSDMSLIIPLLSLTPVFMLPMSFLIINQKVGLQGITGVLLIVLGMFFLKLNLAKKNFHKSIKDVFKEKGAKFMMLVAFIYSFTSILDAIGVKALGNNFQGAIFWVFATSFFSFLILLPQGIKKIRKEKSSKLNLARKLLPIGLTMGITEISQMWAMSFTLAVYVNAIKRLCILFSVVIGQIVFKEKVSKERYIGVFIMLFGFLLITLSSI